ncbi:DUF4097 family beta strand repeat-containing protein [Bradyrhizobium sp. 2S1]|uniref:DUF4097 family beta strand repeat-containing protein n=1 Tax=Bradyrhizobium sp. 2S1 TaxID=1404429 RepID=UPI0014080BDA|nr:DUF4097 family beta strand repeat-containing protein [Bradyrhizobium sp. 2S1]MCK7665014.1 DUF4097 domain-containing protein [Bradyrhizobium sp. 2S1]
MTTIDVPQNVPKSVSLPQGAKISVLAASANITIYSQPTNELTVSWRLRPGDASFVTVEIQTNGDAVINCSIQNRRPSTIIDLQLDVPANSPLTIKTSGGLISLDKADATVDAQTSGGTIEIGEGAADLTLHTSGGQITVGSAGRVGRVGGRINANSSGGNIDLYSVSGSIPNARTSGGDITVELLDPQPVATLQTSGGNISVQVPDSASFQLHACTSGGNVHIDSVLYPGGYDQQGSYDVSIHGAAGGKISAVTSGGNITIR